MVGLSFWSFGSGNGPLRMMLQDGRLWEFPRNAVKGPIFKEIGVRYEEMESSKSVILVAV